MFRSQRLVLGFDIRHLQVCRFENLLSLQRQPIFFDLRSVLSEEYLKWLPTSLMCIVRNYLHKSKLKKDDLIDVAKKLDLQICLAIDELRTASHNLNK